MTDKYNYNVNKNCIEINGDFFAYLDVVDAHKIVKEVNSQDAKIKELEQQNKILKRLYDLDNISDTFYTDAHWIKNKKANSPIANVFNYHDANVLCGLLNNLLPYKLLVRKHKQDLESIYGKPIKEQLHDVLEHDV